MKYRALGRTGLNVSEIGFGAWGIGGRTVGTTSYGDTDDRTSLAALGRALDLGITFYDTSSAYGDGRSEELLGRAFASRRSEVVIATKAGYESWDRPPDFSPAAVASSADRSLKRLQSDYIDLFQLHNPPPEALREGALPAEMSRLQKAGKIRAWGVSAKSPVEALMALNDCGAGVLQANFNMMDVRAETSGLFAEAVRQGAGFIARTPLCFGFLSGMIRRDTIFPAGDHRLGWARAQIDNWIDGASDLLRAVEASPGAEGARSALRFCLSFAAVSSVIPGILTPAEAEANAAASDLGPLPAVLVDKILAINRQRQFFVAPTKPR
jgi:aryl-alcohol dehydrogenase-like predicted oxidoreductase